MAADALSQATSLAGVMEEAGPSCSTEASLSSIMSNLPAPTEHAVAEVLGMIARTSKGIQPNTPQAWNVDIIIDALKAANPAIDWRHVAELLDQPKFDVPDNAALETLMQAWQHATTDPFPIPSLTGRPWNNSAGQLAFIRAATASSPEIFPWDHCEGSQQPLENLHAGKPSTGTPNGCWLCLSLYSVLATLADSGHSSAVRDIMEVPLKTCPEIMLLGVASVNGGWGPLQSELCDSLAVTYVAPHPNSSLVLNRLWHLNQSVVLKAMVSLYSKDISNISRVMEVCQELRSLTEVLNGTPTPFCLELAALASRREYLNLEKWLGEQFGSRGVGFMQDTVKFLADRDDQLTPGASGGKINISVETQAIYLKALARSTDLLPTDTLQQFKVVYGAAVASNSQLQALLTDVSSFEAFAPDIEEETTAYLQKVYNGELTVDQFVETLKSFKNSTVGREQEVLACLVYNLFDEYRFYCKYPEKELSITAVLFGQLIHQGLVSSITLGVALRYVLEALRSPPAENLFGFAKSAIRQFQDEMSQWIKFCQQALAVPGLQELDAELYAIIEKQLVVAKEKEKERVAKTAAAAAAAASSAAKSSISMTGISNISSSSSSSATTVTSAASAMRGIPAAAMAAMTAPLGTKSDGSASSNNAGFPTAALPVTPSNPNMLFSTINAETLEHAAQDVSFPVPDDSLIDKVHFVVNNLAMANIDAKVRELRDLVHAPYYPWFANYMVVKRAAQEPNFHAVYSALVDKWEDRSFRNNFISTTVHYCRVMLISKLLKSNSSERTLLKNLGAWLGKITLAKNRPVLQKDLDVKATIIKAYEEGKMLAVLSFIRQLLDPAIDSKVFRPPNPWVMAICALLAEIYNLENLKTGLKFEVELLFKSLGMNVVDVEPSSLLVGRTREIADNMDFQAPRPVPGAAAGAAGGAAGGAKAGADALGPDGKPTAAAAAAATPVIDPNIIANLHTFIVINPQLQIVGERLGLRRILPMAIDRAVVEIISPVVERSVTIACMTAQELVAKDYATEPEPETVRKAAHLAVTGLAQSLALATAKEPLRMAVGNNLRALLTGQLDAAMLEQVVALLVSDNLDLCCQVIEKAAGERAQREIDERLAPAYTARARAKTANQAFVDQSQFKGRFPASLPEALRPRPAALTPQQTRVYEDFARIPRTAAAAQQQGGGAAVGGEGGAAAAAPGADGNVATTAADAAADLRTRFLNWLQRFDAAISRDPQALLSSLPEGHEVRQLALEAATIPTNEATALDVAKTVFARLYQGNPPTRLHVTAYAGALEALRERVLPRLPAEVTAHFVNLTDEGKFRRDACEALVRVRILVPADLDIHLAKSLATPRYQPPADLIVHLLQSCVIPEPGVLSINDLVHSTNALAKLAARFADGHSALALLEEARRVSLLRSGASIKSGAPGAAGAGGVAATATSAVQEGPKDPPALVETVMKMFDRWARLLEEMPGERQHAAFVQELRAAGFLGASREMTERFVRIMIQLAVQHCLRSEVVTAPAPAAAAGQPPQQRAAQLSFIAVDAFVRLMVCLVTQHGGGPPLLSKVLGILATALQRDAEERGINFNGRPYYRMIVGFLTELTPQKPDQEDTTNMGYLQCIAGFLYATRALRVPSFAFPWLQLLADKRFMPRMLYAPRKTGWPALLQLWLAQLRFLEPFLRNAELNDTLRLLYKGTVRTLLVILHDQPEFLCQFSFQFCDVIPPSSIQLRNMILSAFPRSLRLPDPFTPNLKVDTLPGIVDIPPFVPENIAELLPEPVRNDIEAVMQKQAPAAACLQALRPRLTLPTAETVARGTRYNVPLLNALVFYLGVRSVELNPPSEGTTPQLAGTPAAELMLALLRDLDTEGRYLLLNAAANHLRYPNAHTHYFSCMILHCFDQSTGNEIVKEQITRVLLERLVVNRPHPWGLLITFIELIKNPKYTFWQHAFTRVAPEIERLFDNVARSCLRQNAAGEGGEGGGGGGGGVGRPAAAFPSAA